MRLFVALEVSDTVRQNLAALQNNLRAALPELRWVPPENFHLTLKFIGSISKEELQDIIDMLRGVRPERTPKANFCGLGYSFGGKRGGVLCALTDPSPFLKLLAAQISRRLEHLGFPGEKRDFLPHVTLARFKHSQSVPAIRALVKENSSRGFGSITPEGFHLLESKLGSGGSQYTSRASFSFAMAANA